MRHGPLLIVLLLSISVCVLAQSQNDKAELPKPSVLVSFERQTIRENDSLPVEIRLSNDCNRDLKSVNLHITGPSFLQWHEDSCSANEIQGDLDLGHIPANSILTRTLCVRSNPEIKVGTFNILFAFEYAWEANGKSHQSFVASEKPLVASLFGSDSVGGVPLNLAGFIVPGLFFWLILSHLKVPGSVGLALGEKLIYSLLVSIGIVFVAAWLGVTDVSDGIGIRKLARLGAGGISLGLLVGGGYYCVRAIWLRRIRAKQMDPNDALEVVLEKLLKKSSRAPRTVQFLRSLLKLTSEHERARRVLNKLLSLIPRNDHPRTTVLLKDGSEFIGSLSASSNGTIWLVGWFQISLEGKPEDIARQLKEYAASGKLIEIAHFAGRKKLDIDTRNLIKKRVSGEEENTNLRICSWEKDRVARVVKEEVEALDRVLEIV